VTALRGDQEGRATAIVGEFQGGAALQQEPHGSETIGLGDVVGVARCPHEGGEAVGVAEVRRSAGVQKAADDGRVATRGGVDEGRFAGGVGRGRIRTVPQEERHQRLRAVERGGRQGGDAAAAGLIGRHSTLEEEFDDARSVRFDREEERGRPGEATEGGIGAVIEQQPHDVDAPGTGGFEQRRLAGTVADVDGRAGFEQPNGELEAAALGGEGERLGELARARLDDLGELHLPLPTALSPGGSGNGQRRDRHHREEQIGEAPCQRAGPVDGLVETGWSERKASLMFSISDSEGRRGMVLRIIGSALLVSTALVGAAIAATGNRIVANEKSSTLTVLDSRDRLVETVPTCGRPRGMIFTPDRKQFLVGCADDNLIAIYDVATLKLVRRITNVAAPETFDLHPDGRHLYVSNEEDAQATVFDLETGEQVGAFDTGEEPEGVLATPDGKFVFVTSEAANLVHVIDVDKQAVVKDIVTDTRPRRFALTPDGKELWVSAEVAGVVNVIDMATLEVTHTIEFLPKGMRREMVTPVDLLITRDGKRAFVALGRANHVAVVDVPSKKVTDYILVGRRPWGLRLTRDERLLYVANGLSDDITVIDTASLKALRSIPVGEVPYGLLIDD
jgi:PQQ-dependent catabolism-associated beta-propeller protein